MQHNKAQDSCMFSLSNAPVIQILFSILLLNSIYNKVAIAQEREYVHIQNKLTE